MKALPKKLLPLTLFGIAVTSLFSVRPAQAFTVTLEQVGSDVVATGSGAINLTGLTFFSGDFVVTADQCKLRRILTGMLGGAGHRIHWIHRTDEFRHRGPSFCQHWQRRPVGISSGARALFVPLGYVSGAALSDSMTFNNATFASLGVTPGTYVWSWGTGLPNQNFTLMIGGSGSRWRLNSFSARLRFARLGCLAAQIALLRYRAGGCLRGRIAPRKGSAGGWRITLAFFFEQARRQSRLNHLAKIFPSRNESFT